MLASRMREHAGSFPFGLAVLAGANPLADANARMLFSIRMLASRMREHAGLVRNSAEIENEGLP